MTPRSYGMDEAVRVSAQAAGDIEAWLGKQPETVHVQNVEGDPDYQRIDVDLLWNTTQGPFQVEIKGDRWDKTGNFFFETHSNKERGTPGCFLYTEAHFLFYYFVIPKILYILPMPETRTWFLQNIDAFRERPTTTSTKDGGHYTTVGRLVPIENVLASVPKVRKEQL
jgi:hypothetical protein